VKEILSALARYKLNVDESLLGILGKLGEDELLAPTRAFYPTIYDALKHLFNSDVNWIKRLKAAFPKSPTLAACRFADFDPQALKAPFAEGGARLYADIRELDRAVVALLAELGDRELAAAFSYKNYKGESETHELWKVFLQWFNHGTHHRGAISAHLDALGVENDYSAVLPRI
jgi:uncharacterized damage-inducible protein DinB